MLGLYDQKLFSMRSFQRRRKFREMLTINSKYLQLLQTAYFSLAAAKFVALPLSMANLIQLLWMVEFDLHFFWVVLRIQNVLHARLHTKFFTTDNHNKLEFRTNDDEMMGSLYLPLSPNWPKGDPFWAEFLDTPDFYNFIQRVEKENGTYRDPADTSTFTKALQDPKYVSTIVATFMFHTLFTEQLQGKPLVADTPGQINPHEFLQIYMDIVKPEPFNGLMTSLLSLIKTENKPGEMARYEATRIHYKSIAKSDISGLKVLILSPLGIPVPFQRGPVILQLHFMRECSTNYLFG
jgi:hypothetical protein